MFILCYCLDSRFSGSEDACWIFRKRQKKLLQADSEITDARMEFSLHTEPQVYIMHAKFFTLNSIVLEKLLHSMHFMGSHYVWVKAMHYFGS